MPESSSSNAVTCSVLTRPANFEIWELRIISKLHRERSSVLLLAPTSFSQLKPPPLPLPQLLPPQFPLWRLNPSLLQPLPLKTFENGWNVMRRCYAWSWVRRKRSLWIKGSRYEEGLLLIGSRGSYTRDFLGKGRGFKDTS